MSRKLLGLGALVLTLYAGINYKPNFHHLPQPQTQESQEPDMFESARSLYYEKKFQEAVPHLEIVGEDIGIFAAMLAHSYHMLGDKEKAVFWYQRTAALGTTGDDRGMYEQSRRNERFIPQFGPDPLRFILKAQAEPDYKKSILILEDAIKQFPDNPDLYEQIGHFYRFNGEFEKALEFYDEAIFRQPEDFLLHIHKLYALLEISKMTKEESDNFHLDHNRLRKIKTEQPDKWSTITAECRYIITLNPVELSHPSMKRYSEMAQEIILR